MRSWAEVEQSFPSPVRPLHAKTTLTANLGGKEMSETESRLGSAPFRDDPRGEKGGMYQVGKVG